MPCYAMLCYAMLCYAMLCYVEGKSATGARDAFVARNTANPGKARQGKARQGNKARQQGKATRQQGLRCGVGNTTRHQCNEGMYVIRQQAWQGETETDRAEGQRNRNRGYVRDRSTGLQVSRDSGFWGRCETKRLRQPHALIICTKLERQRLMLQYLCRQVGGWAGSYQTHASIHPSIHLDTHITRPNAQRHHGGPCPVCMYPGITPSRL